MQGSAFRGAHLLGTEVRPSVEMNDFRPLINSHTLAYSRHYRYFQISLANIVKLSA